jgi:excisionase family DNA binding protein
MGAWFTMREAAARLGVSQDTVRRRVKAGELSSRQDPLPGGRFQWMVEVEEDGGADSSKDSNSNLATPTDGEVLALRELVDVLRDQLVVKDRALEARDDELRVRAREVQEFHELLRQSQDEKRLLLAAPMQQLHDGGNAGGQPPQRPWWKVWQRS